MKGGKGRWRRRGGGRRKEKGGWRRKEGRMEEDEEEEEEKNVHNRAKGRLFLILKLRQGSGPEGDDVL